MRVCLSSCAKALIAQPRPHNPPALRDWQSRYEPTRLWLAPTGAITPRWHHPTTALQRLHGYAPSPCVGAYPTP